MNTRLACPLAAALALLPASAAPTAEPRLDLYGDPLPDGAIARLGSLRFRLPFTMSDVRVSPDGKRIVVRANHELLVFDADCGRVLSNDRIELSSAFAWLPDGRGVLLLNDRNSPRLVEFTDAGVRPPAPPPPAWETSVRNWLARRLPPLEEPGPFAFSPAGKLLAADVYDPAIRGRVVVLREVAIGQRFDGLKPVRRLGAVPGGCAGLRFTRDGTALGALCASGKPEEHRFVLWDLATGKERCRRTVPSCGEVAGRWCFALSPDGRWLALGLLDGTARLFDLAGDREPGTFARHIADPRQLRGVSAVAFSPDGTLLVTAGRDEMVRGWDPVSLRETRPGKHAGEWVECIDFSPDGKRMVTTGSADVIRQWDAATFREIEPVAGHRGFLFHAVASPDGRSAVTAGADATLRVWDLATGRQRWRIDLNGRVADDVALVADGETALVKLRNSFHAWDVTTGRAERVPDELARAAETCERFAAVGRTVLLVDPGSLSFWDWSSGRRLRSVDLAGGAERTESVCAGVSLSADGTLLATSRVRHSASATEKFARVDIWDTATGGRVARLECTGLLRVLPYFLPSGHGLVVAGWPADDDPPDGGEVAPSLGLWDPRTGKLRRSFAVSRFQFIHVIASAPDGRTVVTSEEGNLAFFEVATGQVRRLITAPPVKLGRASFSTDGRRLVTTCDDHTALVWDVSLAGAAPPRARPSTDLDRSGLWAKLAESPARPAYEAMARLAADPPRTVAFLTQHLRPAVKPERSSLDRLFANLESDRFAARQRAAAELDRLGKAAVGPARERLRRTESEDGRERLRWFLDRQAQAAPTPEELRQGRAVELLEAIATPEARALLRELAGGEPAAALTRDAAESLHRLEK